MQVIYGLQDFLFSPLQNQYHYLKFVYLSGIFMSYSLTGIPMCFLLVSVVRSVVYLEAFGFMFAAYDSFT